MSNPMKRVASGVKHVARFGIGLVDDTLRRVVGRVNGHDRATPPEAEQLRVPTQPRERSVPKVPERPTPDPYDVGVTTPVGTTGAGPAYNPSTAEADLQQPGTEQIMEPSTTKKIKAEADMLRKAAERNPD